MESHPAPTIAAIEGYCLGGGLELALACDLRVVGEGSTLGLPEVAIDALPSWGATFRLSRIVGLARAKEMVLFGKRLDADEAVAWGLAGESTPRGGARDVALERAKQLASTSSAPTVRRAKMLVNAGFGANSALGRDLELLADSAQLGSDAFEASFTTFGT